MTLNYELNNLFENLKSWLQDSDITLRSLYEDKIEQKINEEFCIDEIYDENNIISWVGKNCDLDEVFNEKEIIEWAKQENVGYIFDDSEIIDYVTKFDPEEVFDENVLRNWALKNGFTEE